MIKKLYEGQKHTISEIQRAIGRSHYYLYRYIGNTNRILKIPMDVLIEMGKFEGIDPFVLREKMLEYAKENSEKE